ncbi:hypothetical protein P5P86_16960 [Nocardioides sp. BP30]|uniref:hypothetical protein n=1 Tax=Nocardioides sp. BP30 TaxID=3036374 RepID=UPI002468AB94|nr:hypothetical protein [Nocardioides sp. BP30]WGL51638.1 hypothetical protein P5P86_16960 [Nocardioides sp. BP30]
MRIEICPESPMFGGGGTLALVGDFLLDGLPEVGEGLQLIEVELLLRSRPQAGYPVGEDSISEADMAALVAAVTEGQGITRDHPDWDRSHEERRAKGPRLTFRRAAGRASVRIVSALSERDVFGDGQSRLEVEPEIFATAAREIVAALADLSRRMKSDDPFDASTFLAHLSTRLEHLPQTQDELRATLAPLQEAAQQRWRSMGPWEVLDVDWTLFAPGTKERLNDPFFFDPADNEAPHGNDAGADLLVEYLEQRPADGWAFLHEQIRDDGYGSVEAMVGDADGDGRELVIATAFAELMVRGKTSDRIVALALEALDRRERDAPSPRNEQLRQALREAAPSPGVAG